MKPIALQSQLPVLTGDANTDIKALRNSLSNVLRLLDSYDPLVQGKGDLLVGKTAMAAGAMHGFLYFPAINAAGPPTGQPTNYGAGDPIVRTRTDNKLWAYDFTSSSWMELADSEDDQEILELLLLILNELELHRTMEL